MDTRRGRPGEGRAGVLDTLQSVAFGTLLRRTRIAAGLTQEELAERAGISRRSLGDMERGGRTRRARTPWPCWLRRWPYPHRSAPPSRRRHGAWARLHPPVPSPPAELR